MAEWTKEFSPMLPFRGSHASAAGGGSRPRNKIQRPRRRRLSTVRRSLDELCVNTIRALSIDAVQKANSGHPGLPLGAAPMAYVLWTRFMRYNPRNPKGE